MKEKMNEHLKNILKTMCWAVNVPFKEKNFKKKDWYRKYSWTKKREKEFKGWMENYLYDYDDARKEITTVRKNKKDIKKAVDEFIFSYGWICK